MHFFKSSVPTAQKCQSWAFECKMVNRYIFNVTLHPLSAFSAYFDILALRKILLFHYIHVHTKENILLASSINLEQTAPVVPPRFTEKKYYKRIPLGKHCKRSQYSCFHELCELIFSVFIHIK